MSKDYFITNDKKKAISELKKLFKKVIIKNVSIEQSWYRIEWISAKDFYRDSLESQREMDKYLKFLLSLLDVESNRDEIKTDAQEAINNKENIFVNLTKKSKKRPTKVSNKK